MSRTTVLSRQSNAPATDKDRVYVQRRSAVEAKTRLRMSLTSTCNFACFFCHNEGQVSNNAPNMRWETVQQTLHEAKHRGVHRITLTGGEPLLYRDGNHNILHVIAAAREVYRDSQLELSVTTNGSRLEQYAVQMASAGLDRVTISVHALAEDVLLANVGSKAMTLQALLVALDAAIAACLTPIKINSVVFAPDEQRLGNEAEIEDLLSLCDISRVDDIRIYGLLPWPTAPSVRRRFIDPIQVAWRLLPKLPLSSEEAESARRLLATIQPGALGTDMDQASVRLPRTHGTLSVDLMTTVRKVGGCGSECARRGGCAEGPYADRVHTDGRLINCLYGEADELGQRL